MAAQCLQSIVEKRTAASSHEACSSSFYGWTTRIRTGNDRTKTCSVTITPSSNAAAKVQNKIEVPKFAAKYLLYDEQVVVLLAFLGKQILPVNQVVGCHGTLRIGQFLLVQRNTAALHHLAHLAL